jgi:tRNA pseudouridine55 synthase
VVNKVRRLAGERSVGHLGTLDPLATGVLPLLIGTATRLARFYGQSDKVYEARVRFGFATDTYDADGEATTEPVDVVLDRELLERALAGFTGRIQQLPPRFSAKKVGGVPSYKLARAKKDVELAPVDVEIFSIDLLDVSGSEAALRVHCGSGTYVRSLAHDLGLVLGCGAHLAELRRTKSGEFSIGAAHTLEELQQWKDESRFEEAVLPAAALLPGFPAVVTDAVTLAQIRHGRDFHTNPFLVKAGSQFVKAVSESGSLVAIGQAVLPNLYHPVVVLA